MKVSRRCRTASLPIALLAGAVIAIWFWASATNRVKFQTSLSSISLLGGSIGQTEYQFVSYRGDGPNDTQLSTRTCDTQLAARGSPLPQRPHKLVSVLIYSREEELMNVRFLEHYDVVDLFVVVEAPFSFTGNPKPLHFADALCRRFAPFAAKIVHVVANFTDDVWQKQPIKQDPASNDAWRREFAMRNSFHAVGRVLGLQPRDLLLQSDVDEIPTALGVLTASRLLWNGLSDPVVPLPAVNFHMKQYFYSLQTYEADGGLSSRIKGRMFFYDALSTCSMQLVRTDYLSPTSCSQMKDVETVHDGIHASYFFPPEGIALKLRSFAHTEASGPGFTEVDGIKQRIRERREPRGADWVLNASNPAEDRQLMRFSLTAHSMLLSFSAMLVQAQS